MQPLHSFNTYSDNQRSSRGAFVQTLSTSPASSFAQKHVSTGSNTHGEHKWFWIEIWNDVEWLRSQCGIFLETGEDWVDRNKNPEWLGIEARAPGRLPREWAGGRTFAGALGSCSITSSCCKTRSTATETGWFHTVLSLSPRCSTLIGRRSLLPLLEKTQSALTS